jgi:16S rRNA (uracil1498-N3)-methyltransferase
LTTAPLFFLDTLPPGDRVELTGDEGRHAARVKRLGVGEAVQVADGSGTVLDCQVATVRPDGLELAVVGRRIEPEPDPRLVVVQALPKGERADLAVELMTELGVDEIVPWAAARSIAQWHGPRAERGVDKWRRTAREAAKQSRRPRVPMVSPLAATSEIALRLGRASGLVLHESASAPLASAPLPSTGEIVLVVGPEGGLSPEEISLFSSAALVRLGAPVLRTSTAGAAALAALSVRLERWR